MVQTAQRLCELCHVYEAPFIVNDRLDVALAVGADGVHVGQEDMPVPDDSSPARTGEDPRRHGP